MPAHLDHYEHYEYEHYEYEHYEKVESLPIDAVHPSQVNAIDQQYKAFVESHGGQADAVIDAQRYSSKVAR